MTGMICASRESGCGGPGEEGFTLIELLIVIIVMGILAAIVVFALSGVTGLSAQTACNADAKSVEVAVQTYYTQTSSYPTSTSQLTSGAYQALRSWPSNPTYYTITLGTGGVVNVTPAAGTPGAGLGAKNYDTYVATGGGNICSLT